MSEVKTFRRIARLDEEFPGQLATLQKALRGLIPDGDNFTEDSYDELFVILCAAMYLVNDPVLRRRSANKSGGNPKIVSMLMDEGEKDKDAILTDHILDRLAPYVPPKEFLGSLEKMHSSKEPQFVEFHVPIQRMTADLWRIVAGFEPSPKCPKALVKYASGPYRPTITALLGA